jgi:hypothetical protein
MKNKALIKYKKTINKLASEKKQGVKMRQAGNEADE